MKYSEIEWTGNNNVCFVFDDDINIFAHVDSIQIVKKIIEDKNNICIHIGDFLSIRLDKVKFVVYKPLKRQRKK